MRFTKLGRIMYDDKFELFYNLFNSMSIGINKDSYLYDQDTLSVLTFNDKYIKATVNPNVPIYAGKTDVLFEPAENYSLIVKFFHYFLKKYEDDEENTIHVFADFIEEIKNPDNKINKQRVVIRTDKGDICTDFFWKTYLAYIHAIFLLCDENPDLTNLDCKPDIK